MKRIVCLAIFMSMSIIAAKAQTDSEEVSDDMIEKIKTGGFKIGADVGFPLSGTTDISNFNFGFYGTYLVEVAENLEVGGLVGYTHFSGDGYYFRHQGDTTIRIDNDSNSFLPIAASARYHFMDHAFFAGLDLGFAVNVSGDADTGMYFRPKFGYNLGMINLLASFQVITAEVDHSAQDYFYNVNGFNSLNIGIEYSF
ncbi:hypothetical protein [Mangrovimonas xylaniphaga]|uniref:hypothetical protein n=1 Tax=Mangrovimonas xylaniphaga TaxID=1645915 RepID=UPI000A893015|nr:hypothetical protein [Mangrovimonas xylaniphaga]